MELRKRFGGCIIRGRSHASGGDDKEMGAWCEARLQPNWDMRMRSWREGVESFV